jgi:O-6-methylguanine DNA methyltransferase
MANRLHQRRSGFAARVLAAVRRIPAGRVATYGDIATLAGAPRAARAVGTVLRSCGDGATPCHRVVGAGGKLGGWAGPLEFKRDRLRHEGIPADLARIQAFHRHRWPSSCQTPAPVGLGRRRTRNRRTRILPRKG